MHLFVQKRLTDTIAMKPQLGKIGTLLVLRIVLDSFPLGAP